MSPTPVTPVTFGLPTQPASYSWEATDAEVAARYGIPIGHILRFDLNTSPAPPEIVAGILASGAFDAPLSEYPPSDYRRLVETAAAVYGVEPDELLVGAGADEVLNLVGKTFLAPGDTAVIPAPTYAMYRVVTEQRGATAFLVPRLGPDRGYALDPERTREAAARAAVVWLCSPNNPTGLPEPDGVIAGLLDGIAADAERAGRPPAIVVIDEAYAEFVGASLLNLRRRHPNVIVVRTASKAYALAGLRVGFAIARPETIARIAPYRPPGSVSTVSVTVVTAALADPHGMLANVARVDAERDRLSDELRDAGWHVGPTVTNFLLVDLGTPDRAAATAEGLLRRGLVPRTFGAGHPLAHCLRLTIRDRAGNDRLIAAAREIEAASDRSGDATAEPAPVTTPLGSLDVTARDGRRVTVHRATRETEVTVTVDLDGSGAADIASGVGFYDHLLASLAHHGLLNLTIRATGDLEVDDHHTVEDVALVLGAAVAEALGDRSSIVRFGDATVPMDESVAIAVIDVGGRPYAVIDLPFRGERAGELTLQMVEHALEAFARTAGATLHVRGTGRNDHHLAEAAFKALGRALRAATEPDPRRSGLASTKGST